MTRFQTVKKASSFFLAPALLLGLSYFVGEIHHLIAEAPHSVYNPETKQFDKVYNMYNWIIFPPKDENGNIYTFMPLEWNIKYVTENVNRLIESFVFLFTAIGIFKGIKWLIGFFKVEIPEQGVLFLKDLKTVSVLICLEYLCYRFLDVIFYFLTAKTYSYWWLFLILSVIIVGFNIWKRKRELIK